MSDTPKKDNTARLHTLRRPIGVGIANVQTAGDGLLTT
jgi:hypothetical protein